MEIDPKDKEKTAFITKQGIFEFNVILFNFINTLVTFQRLMDRLFYDIKNKYILVYLNNINIFSTTFELHLQHLKEILKRFHKANLKLNLKKYQFCQKKLSFLGHVINAEGIKPDLSKINKVKNFLTPINITKLREFISLASYYHRFIQDFAIIVKLINCLLRKDILYI